MGWPAPSAFPPSMGTTGPPIVAGAGLVLGTAVGSPLTAAGLPPTVASTAPVAAPATASRLITTGTRCLGRADGRDGPQRSVAKEGVRRPRASASMLNISPEDTVPGAARPGHGPALAGRDQAGLASAS